MKLGVYSLQKVLFQGDAVSVNCATEAGDITVLDHHAPLISILKEGTMKIIDNNRQAHYIPVSSGFLEIGAGNQAKILVREEGERE